MIVRKDDFNIYLINSFFQERQFELLMQTNYQDSYSF